MAAYVIVDIDINDPAGYDDYKKLTPASLVPYEGKFVVRGGAVRVLEGSWKPGRMVVLEFPTFERANQWWCSAEYAPAKAIRQRTAHSNMIVVEGFAGIPA